MGLAISVERSFRRTSLKARLKLAVFRRLKHNPRVKLVSIMPFYAEPRIASYVDDWIFDVQFWDLPILGIHPGLFGIRKREKEFIKLDDPRVIVSSIGKQIAQKGSVDFCELYIKSEEIRKEALFTLAGDCTQISSSLLAEFQAVGGRVVDKHLSDTELLDEYSSADIVWACYSQAYDQSSGIFGRSYQLGKPCIIRSGSYLSKICAGLRGYKDVVLELENGDDLRVPALLLFFSRIKGLSPPPQIEHQMDSQRLLHIFDSFFSIERRE